MDSGILFALLALLSWGTSDFLISYAMKKESAVGTLFVGKAFGLLFLGIGVLVFQVPLILPSSPLVWGIVFLAAITTTIAWFMFAEALKRGALSIISPIGNAWPLVAVILGIFFLHEAVVAKTGIGAALVLGGIVFLSLRVSEVKARIVNLFAGASHALVAMLLWGVFFIFVAMGVEATSWIAFPVLLEVLSTAMLGGYLLLRHEPIPISPSVAGFGIANVVGMVTYGLALLSIPTTVAAPIETAIPLVAVLLAHVFFKERLELQQYGGILLIIGGLVVLSI